MGREIRRVPKGWKHPRTDYYGDNRYKPLYNESYESTANKWVEGFKKWMVKYPTGKDSYGDYFWDYEGTPPDKEDYRPDWAEKPTCYQIYETVSEGTPISPVFETKEEMVKWLISVGYSEDTAKKFVDSGWVPSGLITGGNIYSGIDIAGKLPTK